MPMYDFHCNDCGHEFTLEMRISEYEQKKGRECPACGSGNVERMISSFMVQTSKKS